jgi:hypothetical protein
MIEPFDSEAGYRAAIDATIEAATQELRIFDGDLARLGLDEPSRQALLAGFLSDGAGRRLLIVLHDIEPLCTRHPRMLNLMRSHGHLIEVRQSPAQLRHLADRFVLADRLHGAIRFHVDHPRGKRVIADGLETQPHWDRFNELWEVSEPRSPAASLGI